MRALLIGYVVLAPLLLGATPPAQAQGRTETSKKAAASAFERGQKLYQDARYAEAILAFTEAHRLAPHPSALYNIGRCNEALGNVGQAIEHYDRALQLTKDENEQQDLRRRIARLRAVPVRVFISSQPSGARVTVDGAKQAEPQPTPLVVRLRPGEHILVLRREGYQLATRRVEVEVEKEQPVEVLLEPVPPPCPPEKRCAACPPPPACPDYRLVDFDKLHLHLAVMGVFGITQDRALAGGPGIQALASYRRWIFGGHFFFLPWDEVPVPAIQGVPATYDRAKPSWLLGQVEFGRVFSFRFFYVYTTAGIGISAERTTFRGTSGTSDDVKERVALSWSLSGGIETMVTRWLSFGVGSRFGMIHGKRGRTETTEADEGHYPYGLVYGLASFHL